MSNTISSDLQLTEVLDSALQSFRRAILPLTAFSTVFEDVELKGEDTVAVPYYPLATSASQSREPDGSYKALASNTTTQSRKVTVDKNKVQAISFTSTERVRQPKFDPVRHGQLKGEKLAYDIIADILSAVRVSDFSTPTINAMAASSFDEDDMGDLAQKAMEEYWPEAGRSAILSPAFYFNLLKQEAIVDVSKYGSDAAIRDAVVKRVMGFDTFGTAGFQANNTTAIAVSGADATDLFTTVVDHGYKVGDRIRFPALTGGSSLTADTGRYFVIEVPSAKTFKVSATAGGTSVDLGSNVTDGTVQKYENLGGFVCFPSAILTAFAPVPPSDKMRAQLGDYRIVKDERSKIVLEYKHILYPDTDQEVQVIEAHYGFGLGETAALKPILIS